MNNPIILSKTKQKPSYSFEGDWYKEYAIQKVDDQKEIAELFKKYPGINNIYGIKNLYVSMRRRIDLIDENPKFWEWQALDFQDGAWNAAMNIGDSDFYQGETFHPLHAKIVEYCDKRNALRKEQSELSDYLTPHKFQLHSELFKEYQEEYYKELKKRKLYSKAMDGKVAQDVIDAIRKPIQDKYLEKRTTLDNRIGEINHELSDLESIKDYFYDVTEEIK